MDVVVGWGAGGGVVFFNSSFRLHLTSCKLHEKRTRADDEVVVAVFPSFLQSQNGACLVSVWDAFAVVVVVHTHSSSHVHVHQLALLVLLLLAAPVVDVLAAGPVLEAEAEAASEVP